MAKIEKIDSKLLKVISICLLLICISSCMEDNEAKDNEIQELHRLYSGPMRDITRLLSEALRKCVRLPTPDEFYEFMLNGAHENIKCSETITGFQESIYPEEGNKRTIVKNLPNVKAFLDRREYKVYQNGNDFFVVLALDSKTWKYKYSERELYEIVVYCNKDRGLLCDHTQLRFSKINCKGMENTKIMDCYPWDME